MPNFSPNYSTAIPDDGNEVTPCPFVSRASNPINGITDIPGDKSISHRALIIGSLAAGKTTIDGLLPSTDIAATIGAMRSLGAVIIRRSDVSWLVHGVGVGGLSEPNRELDLGNSGTAARLIAGVCASHPFTTFMTGDASLRNRPMNRVIEPLERMGANFVARLGGRLPLAVIGAKTPMPIEYQLSIPSAQVKSAVLLAGLSAPGETQIIESASTRDHTERMLKHFGAQVRTETGAASSRRIIMVGQPELEPCNVTVPGDMSAAAFPLAAALVVPKSNLLIRNVGINPGRTGLLDTLREMGAVVELMNIRENLAEPMADISASAARLHGVEVPTTRAPSMIDEYPILSVIAACASGKTRLNGLAELRVKESDRLHAIAAGLRSAGVEVDEQPDRLDIIGCGGAPPGGGTVRTHMDHRIGMAFLTLGMASQKPMVIDDASMIETSFPEFVDTMNRLGASIERC